MNAWCRPSLRLMTESEKLPLGSADGGEVARHGAPVAVDAHAVAAGILRREERAVGTVHEVVEVVGVVGVGDAEARGDGRGVPRA